MSTAATGREDTEMDPRGDPPWYGSTDAPGVGVIRIGVVSEMALRFARMEMGNRTPVQFPVSVATDPVEVPE